MCTGICILYTLYIYIYMHRYVCVCLSYIFLYACIHMHVGFHWWNLCFLLSFSLGYCAVKQQLVCYLISGTEQRPIRHVARRSMVVGPRGGQFLDDEGKRPGSFSFITIFVAQSLTFFLLVNSPFLLTAQTFPIFHSDAQVRSHWHHLGGLADR